MNPVYIRMAFFTLAPLVALLPFATYDPEAFTLLIDLDAASAAVAAALAMIGAVFRKWGKK